MNLMRVAILGCWALLCAVPSSPGGQEFPTSFCPECWKILSASDARCGDACAKCGKPAVAIDAATLTWYWCLEHEYWHRRPCPEARHRKSGRVRTALAMVVSDRDERLAEGAYCPECRIFPDPMKNERGHCPSCHEPLVATQTIEATWFWCTHEDAWKTEPCPENSLKHCCLARSGTLLAKPRSLLATR